MLGSGLDRLPQSRHTVSEFVYTDAPLVELIAEVFWQTIALEVVPNAAVDPAFAGLSPRVQSEASERGLATVESTVPFGVAIELLAGKPTVRFRRSPDQWPLMQLGPGVLVCNAVPPYQGWSTFRAFVADCVQILEKCWPLPDPASVVRLRLRYLNAFTEKHGYSSDADFLGNSLRAGSGVDSQVVSRFSTKHGDVHISTQTTFPVDAMPGSRAVVNMIPGRSRGFPAYVADLSVETVAGEPFGTPADSLPWFDQAHALLSSLFFSLTTTRLQESFGDRIAIAGAAE